jgi:NADP-dependent 3-hydroxy acid dehydrogenase YdfG
LRLKVAGAARHVEDNLRMDLGLRDRACIVTGASRGIGRATALTLAGEGAAVLLVGRREGPLEKVAADCARAGGAAATAALDVTAPDAPQRLIDHSLRAWGRLDALVNNAGTSEVKALERTGRRSGSFM